METTGLTDTIEVAVTRAFRIEPWMLILIVLLFVLWKEFNYRNNMKKFGVT